jgi:hypothetical protein
MNQCQYIYIRGRVKGTTCNKDTNDIYCAYHVNKLWCKWQQNPLFLRAIKEWNLTYIKENYFKVTLPYNNLYFNITLKFDGQHFYLRTDNDVLIQVAKNFDILLN